MFSGAAGMTALQVLINPGDFLCYRGQGRGSGDNSPAQFLRMVKLALQGPCPLRRCPGRCPLRGNMRRRVLELGHPAIGLILTGRQQISGTLQGLGQAFLLAPDGGVQFSCALGWRHVALTRVGLALTRVGLALIRGWCLRCPE